MADDHQQARNAADETTQTRVPVPQDDEARDVGKPQEDLEADDLKGFVKDPLEQ